MPVVPVPCDCGGAPCPPISSTGLCLADGTPIAVVYSRDCDSGAMTELGFINLLTGIFTPGMPPAGTRACGERDFELTNWCDLAADGSVIAHVVIEYQYDEVTGQLIGSRLLDLLGQPYNGGNGPVGTLGSCGNADEVFQHQEILCDHRPGTPGSPIATSDATVTGTAHNVPPAQKNMGAPVDIPLAASQQFFNGQAINVGPGGVNEHDYTGATLVAAPECGTLDPAGSSTLHLTARITNTGANCGCGLWGYFKVWDGNTDLTGAAGNLGVLNGAAANSICPGQVVTKTIDVVVPNASLIAGTIDVTLNVQTGQDGTPDGAGCPVNNPGGTTYTLDQFAATVDPVPVVGCTGGATDGPVVPFIRKYIENAAGQVLETVDLTFDGLGYLVQGNVGVCPPADDPEQTFGLQLCDVQADGTAVPFVRTYTVNCGEIVQSCDKDLGGVDDYEPTGTVGQCPVTLAASSECQDCEYIELADSTPVPVAVVSLVNADPTPWLGTMASSQAIGDPGQAQKVWDGGVGVFPPQAVQGRHTMAVARLAVCEPCGPPVDVQATVTARFRNDGPVNSTEALWGRLAVWNGLTKLFGEDLSTPLAPGQSYTSTITGAIPVAAILAGDVVVEFNVETNGENNTPKAWTVDQFEITITAAAAGCGQRFVRRICRDCDGAVVGAPVDTLDGVTPYVPVGAVAPPATAPQCIPSGDDCRTCETVEVCDTGTGAVSQLIGAANASAGAFPNGVTWTSVAYSTSGTSSPRPSNDGVGNPEGLWWTGCNGFPAETVGPVEWTWGTPQITEFSVAMVWHSGVDTPPLIANTMQLPAGVTPIYLPSGYHWDPVLNQVSVDSTRAAEPGSVGPNCASIQDPTIASAARFRTDAAVSQVRIDYLGARVAGCGQFCPYGYGAFQIGSAPTRFLRTICRDCDGAVIDVQNTTLDGVEYFPIGAVGHCDCATDHCDTITLCDTFIDGQLLAPSFANDPEWIGGAQTFADGGRLSNGVAWTWKDVQTGGFAGWTGTINVGFTTANSEPNALDITLDETADVSFKVGRGAGAAVQRCVILPEGTVQVSLAAGHSYDPVTRTFCVGTTAAGVTSTFRTLDQGYLRWLADSGAGTVQVSEITVFVRNTVSFLRRICRDCSGTVTGSADTTLDGQTAYVTKGRVTDCAATDQGNCCIPNPICIQQESPGRLEFISNSTYANGNTARYDGGVDTIWEWTSDVVGNPGTDTVPGDGSFAPAPGAVWYPMYRPTAYPSARWNIVDPDPLKKAGYITPHRDSGANTTGFAGESPNQVPAWWIARARFKVPDNADPSSLRISATALNADQYARAWRFNNGPWNPILGTTNGCPFGAGNADECAPTQFAPMPVSGAGAGDNFLYLQIHETVVGSCCAGLIVHMNAFFDYARPAQRSFTLMTCCDDTQYYIDDTGQRVDHIPTGWVQSVCSPTEYDPILLCDATGTQFIRNIGYFSDGQVRVSDMTLAGDVFIPTDPVGQCGTGAGDALLNTGVRHVTGVAAQNLKTAFPGLQSVTLTVLAGSVLVTATDGVNQSIPTGVSLTWSTNDTDDSSLQAWTAVGSAAAADYLLVFTYKTGAAG